MALLRRLYGSHRTARGDTILHHPRSDSVGEAAVTTIEAIGETPAGPEGAGGLGL